MAESIMAAFDDDVDGEADCDQHCFDIFIQVSLMTYSGLSSLLGD
jgi:hypothetical protein